MSVKQLFRSLLCVIALGDAAMQAYYVCVCVEFAPSALQLHDDTKTHIVFLRLPWIINQRYGICRPIYWCCSSSNEQVNTFRNMLPEIWFAPIDLFAVDLTVHFRTNIYTPLIVFFCNFEHRIKGKMDKVLRVLGHMSEICSGSGMREMFALVLRVEVKAAIEHPMQHNHVCPFFVFIRCYHEQHTNGRRKHCLHMRRRTSKEA